MNRFSPSAPGPSPRRAPHATMPADGSARRLPGRRVRAVGQDRRPGRRGRCPGAGPRAGSTTTSTARSTCSCRATAACPSRPPRRSSTSASCACPDPRARTGVTEVTVIDVAADGYRLRLVDHPPAFDRAGVLRRRGRRLRRQRLAVRAVRAGRAGDAARATAGRSTSSISTTGRPGRPAIFRALRYADDPIIGAGGDRHDAPQPRLSRLDRQRRPGPARAAAGRRRAGPERRRHRPPGRGHRGRRDRQHRLARATPARP